MKAPQTQQQQRMARRLRRRYAAEKRFRFYGLAAICSALAALVFFLGMTLLRGVSAFYQHTVELEIAVAEELPALAHAQQTWDAETLRAVDWNGVVNRSLRAQFPPEQSETRGDRRKMNALLSSGAAFDVLDALLTKPAPAQNTVKFALPLSADADLYFKGEINPNSPESDRKLNDKQIDWLNALAAQGRVQKQFWWRFFSDGDSREPELAGIRGTLVGTFWTLLVTLLLSLPLGVAAAIYLEEFAPKNRWTDLVEVNINNLAAVPSIVFGLLGLAVFLNFFGMPRSVPMVGGVVLALLTLPTIIIAGRSAIMAVPPSIREAALGVGASPVQVVFQHVLPLALPGILTGAIIGMARALGETAPLLMVGMVAFIVDIPAGPMQPATTLPVQVFLWADSPDRAFAAKTSAAILVLLSFLVLMNLAAVLLRNRFERRW